MNSPFFITGYERSGTTMLRRLVSMHPELDYEIIHERRKLLMNSSSAKDAIKNMTYDATQAGKKTGSIMSVLSGQKIPYINYNQAASSVDKFVSLFPNAFILHIVRNPISAINSQVKTFNRNPNKCVNNYFNSVPNTKKMLEKRANVRTVLYEDVVSDPLNSVKSIYEWMGKPVNESYIDKVISTRDAWEFEGRIMCGLRNFDKIQNTKSKIVLSNDIINQINKREQNEAV